MNRFELGVCSWSIDRNDPVQALVRAGELGLHAVQVGYFDEAGLEAFTTDKLQPAATAAGVRIHSVFLKFPREDYSSIAFIAESAGYVCDEHAAERHELTVWAGRRTAELGCTQLAVHAGTVPRDPQGERYARFAERVAAAARSLQPMGVTLLLETGQESAAALMALLESVGEPNVAVNYDSGNFILYGSDDPVAAVHTVAPRLACVHVKDAVRSAEPGVAFGRAVPLGEGDAQIPAVLTALREVNYTGPLLIENPATAGGAAGLPGARAFLQEAV